MTPPPTPSIVFSPRQPPPVVRHLPQISLKEGLPIPTEKIPEAVAAPSTTAMMTEPRVVATPVLSADRRIISPHHVGIASVAVFLLSTLPFLLLLRSRVREGMTRILRATHRIRLDSVVMLEEGKRGVEDLDRSLILEAREVGLKRVTPLTVVEVGRVDGESVVK